VLYVGLVSKIPSIFPVIVLMLEPPGSAGSPPITHPSFLISVSLSGFYLISLMIRLIPCFLGRSISRRGMHIVLNTANSGPDVFTNRTTSLLNRKAEMQHEDGKSKEITVCGPF
jgi:hypothetical protein